MTTVSQTSYGLLLAKSMTEAELERNVHDAATKLGYVHYHTKFSWGSNAGFPDDVLGRLSPHRLIYAELKRQDKDPTSAQLQWLELLYANGQEVYVWRPLDWLNGTITEILAMAVPQQPRRWTMVRTLPPRGSMS